MTEQTKRGRGRPPRADVAAEHRVSFAMTSDELDSLRTMAADAAMSVSEFIRGAIFDAQKQTAH